MIHELKGPYLNSKGKWTYYYPDFIAPDLSIKHSAHTPTFKSKKDAQDSWDLEIIKNQPIRKICIEHISAGFSKITIGDIIDDLMKNYKPNETIRKCFWVFNLAGNCVGFDYLINSLYDPEERQWFMNKIQQLYPDNGPMHRTIFTRINFVLKAIIKKEKLPDGLFRLATNVKDNHPISKKSLSRVRPSYSSFRLMVKYVKWLISSPIYKERLYGVTMYLFIKYQEFCLSHMSVLRVKDINYPYLTLPPKGRATYPKSINIESVYSLLLPFINGKSSEALIFSLDKEGLEVFDWSRLAEKYRAIRAENFPVELVLAHFKPKERRRTQWGQIQYGRI